MSYEPMDTYLPSARGGAAVPQLVGQREEAARSYAASAGWTVLVRHVVPPRRQPAGFVVRQEPAAGSVAPVGAVLVVDVSRRPRLGDRYGRALLAGASAAFAVTTGVFASLWLEERARVEPVETPVWVGEPQETVEAFARREGLVLTVQTVDASSVATGSGVAPGTVLVQAPGPGVPLSPGSVVVITVAAEPG